MDSSGNVVSHSTYDAYGAEASVNASGATITPTDEFGYNARWGYIFDRETGLYLCQNRYYDPSQGRWLTRDPIGFGGGMNRYAYCAGIPYNVDPDGFGEGHHWMPQSIFKAWSDAANEFFKKWITGPLSKSGVHQWDAAHRDYRAAVKQLANNHFEESGIDPSKLSRQEAADLAEKVIASDDPRITGYVSKIAAGCGEEAASTFRSPPKVTSGGSGAALGAIATVASGAEALGQGMYQMLHARQRWNSYFDEIDSQENNAGRKWEGEID